MTIDNELVKTHHKALSNRLKAIEEYITSGPSSEINSDEVAMEYFRRLGHLEGLRESLALFENSVKAYYGQTADDED